MKRLFIIAFMAIAAISVFAQEDVYKSEMDILDAQGDAIIKEYRELMKDDPKAEKSIYGGSSCANCGSFVQIKSALSY